MSGLSLELIAVIQHFDGAVKTNNLVGQLIQIKDKLNGNILARQNQISHMNNGINADIRKVELIDEFIRGVNAEPSALPPPSP